MGHWCHVFVHVPRNGQLLIPQAVRQFSLEAPDRHSKCLEPVHPAKLPLARPSRVCLLRCHTNKRRKTGRSSSQVPCVFFLLGALHQPFCRPHPRCISAPARASRPAIFRLSSILALSNHFSMSCLSVTVSARFHVMPVSSLASCFAPQSAANGTDWPLPRRLGSVNSAANPTVTSPQRYPGL